MKTILVIKWDEKNDVYTEDMCSNLEDKKALAEAILSTIDGDALLAKLICEVLERDKKPNGIEITIPFNQHSS